MINDKLGVLIIQDMVLFPNSEIRIESDNTEDKNIIALADSSSKQILVVNPIIEELDDITSLPKVGVLAQIKLKMDVPNGKTRLVLKGIKRLGIDQFIEEDNLYKAIVKEVLEEEKQDDIFYCDLLIKAVERYISIAPYISNAIVNQIRATNNLTELTDLIASFIPIDYSKKKRYITELDCQKRAKYLIEDMNEDLKKIEIEQQLEKEVEKEISENQKEFYLREKIKIIQKELGDINSKDDDIETFKNKLKKLKVSKKIKDKITKEINRYQSTNSSSPELGMIRDYIDWMLNIPWSKCTKDIEDLNEVKHTLDNSHYGLTDVKDRILEYLAVKQNTNNLRSPIICLVGPPGVGKTSLAISIAKSLNRKVAKISVGGINDEAEIVGHRRTYIGAIPGRIIQGIRKASSSNPVFIIDEIDKMRKDIKGDPASSLLEVLDPEQNSKFSDHYIEEEYDLSKVMFIATANYIDQIPIELRDRLEIIELSSYTEYEKLDIAKNHLIPKQLTEHGLTELQVSFTDQVILTIIRNYTKEAGVRSLERLIATILRKVVKKFLIEKNIASIEVDNNNLEQFIGKAKYHYLENAKQKQIGVVNGMAYTAFGGDILPIEVTYYKGKGNLILTGSLGDVMKESAHIALSYIKANINKFNIDEKILEDNDIHIHVPEGATPKDGPSAGITLTTALISLLKEQAVSGDISMTGEITLRGNILPIGGLKEKVIGAHRAGIKKVYLPKDNEKDLDEIPEDIRGKIKFIFVDNYSDVFKKIFKE